MPSYYSDQGSSQRSGDYIDRFRTNDNNSGSISIGERRPTKRTTSERLQVMIDRATSPMNLEPNLSLNLEIADFINAKQGNTPREAAIAVVKQINSRISSVSILALALLDILVKNCGYPFHLQISRKEFLNELVRKFPETPPPRATRTQYLILQAIEEWRQTICRTSRYKKDLGYIRDMHRLLRDKGYIFPEINREDAAVLNPSDEIKSPEELEKEERDVLSAKLQELIRRGTPSDLREANKIMKIMAGYDNGNKPDYKAIVAKELDKVRRKAELFDDMLKKLQENLQTSPNTSTSNDTLDEMSESLKVAQSKIQKIIQQESEDEDAVSKLLNLNDYMHSLVEKYTLIKQGNLEQASQLKISKAGDSASQAYANKKGSAVQDLSLIDFGDEDTSPAPSGSAPISLSSNADNKNTSSTDLLSSLGNLDFQPSSDSTGLGAINLNNLTSPTSSSSSPAIGLSTTQNNLSSSNSSGPNYSALEGLANLSISHPQPQHSLIGYLPSQGQAPQLSSKANTTTNQSVNIPSKPPTSNLNSPTAFAFQHPISTSASPSLQSNNTSAENISNLPELVVLSSMLRIVFRVLANPASIESQPIVVYVLYSNNSPSVSLTDITFEIAVPKSLRLELGPQNGKVLTPSQQNGIVQTLRINGAKPNHPVKLRWKVLYKINGAELQENGEIPALPIS